MEEQCIICGIEMLDYEPAYCCNGRDCGCMGMPVEPPICSKECWDNLDNLNKGSKNAEKI